MFVPDLRFLKAAGGVLAEDLAKRPAAEAAERAYLEYLKKAVSYLFLFRRGEEAEALFEKWLERLRPAVSAAIAAEASFQEVLLEMLSPGVLGGPKEGMLQALASCLEASLLLRAAGKDGSSEEVLSRGFLDLARLLHRESLKRLGEGALAPFEAYWIQSAERLSNRWKADPKTAHLAGLVQPPSPDLLPEKGAGIGLPEPHELLFRVDRLDPLRCPKDGL